MDAENPSSMLPHELAAGVGAGLPLSLQPSCKQEMGLAAAKASPLDQPDPALQEEARIAMDIVQGIRAGADCAETMLVKRYSRGLQYFLMRRVNDPDRVRDLLQETLCIAIVKLRETDLDRPERLAGYLRGIAIRVAMNAGRRRKRAPYLMESEALAEIPDNAPRPFQFVAREQAIEAVRKLLRTMPIARDRELLTRYYVHDENKEDICKALNLDSLHFNRVLFRAKGRFKKLLQAKVAGDDLDPD